MYIYHSNDDFYIWINTINNTNLVGQLCFSMVGNVYIYYFPALDFVIPEEIREY